MAYIEKAFTAATVPVGETTEVIFVVTNIGEDPVTGVEFTDTLPLDMVIATPNELRNPNSLTITAVAGTNVISMTGASLDVDEIVTFSLRVRVPSVGVYSNVTSNLTTIEDGEISDTEGRASITSLLNGLASQWMLMRMDVKVRTEEEA